MVGPLREDEVLPDSAIVIKGGVLPSLRLFRESAQDCFEAFGVYGVSVCCLPGMTADEIARAVPEGKLPHSYFRQTTVGALRSLGFDVVPSLWEGHATLTFPGLPSDQDWARLQAVFEPRQCNPVR